jgi:hypothetical protein
MKKVVKSILFEMDIEGFGIVNFDGNAQKSIPGFGSMHKNVKYAKRNFYTDPISGKTIGKIKISSNSLRNGIFRNSMVTHSPSVATHNTLFNSFISTPYAILAGYLLIDGKVAYKKKSPLCICDAEETNGVIAIKETFSRSGEKKEDDEKKVDVDNTKKDDVVDSGSDTTYYLKDTVGKIEYSTKGSIDIHGLEFTSCDKMFDRYSFDSDMYGLIKGFLNANLGGFDGDLGYYKLKKSVYDIPERGFQFSDENKRFLLRSLLNDILLYETRKSGAYAKTKSLRLKCANPAVDDSDWGWVELKNRMDVDNFIDSIDFHEFYEATNIEEAAVLRKEMIIEATKARKEVAASKKAKKAIADAAKAKKALLIKNKKALA